MKKRKIGALLLGAALVGGVLAVPQAVQSSIPFIYYVTPSRQIYQNTVQCNGAVQAANMYEIRIGAACMPQKVEVQLGDFVQEGEALALLQPLTDAGGADGAAALGEGLGYPPLEELLALAEDYGLASYFGIDMQILAQLEAALPIAAKELPGNAIITEDNLLLAPVSGILSELNLSDNRQLGKAEVAATIIDPANYTVLVAVGEGDIFKIKLGNTAVVRGSAFAGKTYKGVVSKIFPSAHKAYLGSGSDTVVDVEISILNPDNRLRPGFSAKVEIAGGSDYELITVPYEAVRQDENNNEYVYTYNDGSLRKTPVITGQELINEVEVLSGLTPESIVIFNPGDGMQEGAIIQIKGRADDGG